MAETFRVTVERNRLRFAAAHMATFGGECEPLHGHNYEVIVDVEGDLTADGWVWDFGGLKAATAAILGELDHRFLLQRESALLQVIHRGESIELRAGNRTYVLPCSEVVALPIDNTTAEELARFVAVRLLADLRALGAGNIRRLTVGIEEMPGQTGWYTVD